MWKSPFCVFYSPFSKTIIKRRGCQFQIGMNFFRQKWIFRQDFFAWLSHVAFVLLSKLFLSQPAPASSQSCTATSHSRMTHGRGKKWIFACNIQLSGSSNSRRSHNIYISEVLLQLSNPLGVNMQGFKVWASQFTSCLWGQSYRDSVGLLQHDIMYSSIKRSLSFYRETNTLPQKPIRQNIEYDRKFRRIQQSTHCCALDLRHNNASGRALLREQSPLTLQAQFSSTDWKLKN